MDGRRGGHDRGVPFRVKAESLDYREGPAVCKNSDGVLSCRGQAMQGLLDALIRQIVECDRVFDAIFANARASKRGEISADAEHLAQIARDCADVCASSAI